jgi:hypothetical protein
VVQIFSLWTIEKNYVLIPIMQTLGLSESSPRTESRLKSLFWPSIQTAADLDYLGSQGYWVCAIVAVFSFAVTAFTGHPIAGVATLLFYYLGGVGVREHSRYAAVVVFVLYIADTLLSGPGVLKVFIAALLLSNIRATWIASQWKPESDEAVLPPRFSETWSDKFADQLPMWLWPKVRIAYYIFSAGFLILAAVGLAVLAHHRAS